MTKYQGSNALLFFTQLIKAAIPTPDEIFATIPTATAAEIASAFADAE